MTRLWKWRITVIANSLQYSRIIYLGNGSVIIRVARPIWCEHIAERTLTPLPGVGRVNMCEQLHLHLSW